MKQYLLLALFFGLMADGVFGWGLVVIPGLSFKNALLYLLVLLIGVEVAASGRKPVLEFPQVHLLFIALLVIATFSWISATLLGASSSFSPVSGLASLKGNIVDHYLFFLVFFLGLRTTHDVLRLQRWILLMIAVGNVATVMDAYNLPDLSVIETREGGRVTGPLGEANQYGLFVAMFLPILVAKAWSERGLWRVLFTVGAAATFWVLLLTVSRGAFVSLIVGSLIAVLLLRHHLNAVYVKRVLAIGVVASVGAMFLLGQQYIDLIMERTVLTTERGDAFDITSGRTWVWSRAIVAMLEQPLTFVTGNGLSTFRPSFGIAPHSVYVGYLFELGIPGLLVFVALLSSIAVWTLRAIRRMAAAKSGQGRLPELMGFLFGYLALTVGIASVDLADPWYFIWAYVGMSMRLAAIALTGREQAR